MTYEISQTLKTTAERYPLNIIAADDNPGDMLIMVRYMEALGYNIDCVEDGDRLLEVIQESSYDLILTDIVMPTIDGIECTRRIRAGEYGEENRGIYIIGFTAYNEKGKEEEAMNAGMNNYYAKPVALTDLADAIQTCGKQCARLLG